MHQCRARSLGAVADSSMRYDRRELAAFRADKRRKQLEKRRRDKGVRSKAEYLAELASRPKPWEAEGIHRRTWEKRRRKAARCDSSPPQGVSPIIVSMEETHVAASVQRESQQEASSKEGEVKSPSNVTTAEVVERLNPSSPHELESEVAASDDERLIAMNNWGKNAERKKSTLSQNRKSLGPNPCSVKSFVTSRSFRWRQTNSLSRRHHEQRDYISRCSVWPTRSLVVWRSGFQNQGCATGDSLSRTQKVHRPDNQTHTRPMASALLRPRPLRRLIGTPHRGGGGQISTAFGPRPCW